MYMTCVCVCARASVYLHVCVCFESVYLFAYARKDKVTFVDTFAYLQHTQLDICVNVRARAY